MDSYDIAVIGGGPVGSFAALSIMSRSKTTKVVVFEQHQKSGYPPHCSGLIGIDGLKLLNIYHSLAKRVSFNRIKAAKFYSPSGQSFIIDRRNNELLVLNRPRLDFLLAKQAQRRGATFQYLSSVKKINYDKQERNWGILGDFSNMKNFQATAKVIISAEGHHPRISPQAGLPAPSKRWFLPALQFELENVRNIDKEIVELYFGNKYAPGFFIWLIPLNEEKARVGLAMHPYISQGVRKYLNYAIAKHPILSQKLRNSSCINSWGGFVPVSGPIVKTFTDGIMVAGDAAGQSKATTGGGFNIGAYCGYLAGKVAYESIRTNDNSSSFLRAYQKLWHSVFGPELKIMKLIRKELSFLPDKTLDTLFDIAIQTSIDVRMQKVQNIDFHGLALLKYSFSPRVLIKGLRLVPQAAVSLLQGLSI